jgi:hypothetical protein
MARMHCCFHLLKDRLFETRVLKKVLQMIVISDAIMVRMPENLLFICWQTKGVEVERSIRFYCAYGIHDDRGVLCDVLALTIREAS